MGSGVVPTKLSIRYYLISGWKFFLFTYNTFNIFILITKYFLIRLRTFVRSRKQRWNGKRGELER